ncbi:nitrogen regulatory protein P-II family [Ezakiella coagulans]|uniref:Nitrogen regulatory protein P-II family n=1 Tax=Ezakiella coagulans TaxID=46507 RepID=A0A2U1E1G9_9FIRM|nr:P-II family nitrogen regulator [Ezakiella coagulans]KGF07403.1 hypothetical protein HMPREF1634_04615 [Tissierellia bacterium S7-1-4]PVY93758.1 nitrogen regulatory protein P-II family [Ezakiella coagulans]UQK61546.1 hypothetical protein M1R54_04460 [Ezakiella coagulans]
MKALFLILNKTEKLNDVLEAYVKVGIKGATVVDSQGMGSALSESNLPMFGGFLRTVLDNNRPFNKVIFSVVKDEEVLNDAIAAVEDILGDMSKPGVGLMFVMPVDRVVGWTK